MYRLLPPRVIVALAATLLVDIYLVRWFFDPLRSLDLWITFLVYYYLFHMGRRSLTFAVVLGVVCDLMGRSAVFGISVIGMTVTAMLLILVSDMFHRERWYVQMPAVFLALLSSWTVELTLTCLLKNRWDWFAPFGAPMVTAALVTAALSPFVLAIYKKTLGTFTHQLELFA